MENFKNIEAAVENKRIAKLFKIGKTYEFYIESEEKTPLGKGLFNLISKNFNTKHIFCFEGQHTASPGESIYLTASEISPNGYLILTEPAVSLTESDLTSMRKIDDVAFEREGQNLEFKSSFAHDATRNVNIDSQLGFEIMQQIAAMLNSDGGEVRIGYRYNGQVCGINKDLPYLNSSKTDNFCYKYSLDGIELKIRNTIVERLGRYANSLVDIEFFKTSENLVVIHLYIKAASVPVYMNNKFLYVRTGNISSNMLGNDLTTFICERCGITKPTFFEETKTEAPQMSDAAVHNEKTDDSSFISTKAKSPAISTYLTFYRNGEISSQGYAVDSHAVLFDVPVSSKQLFDKKTRLVIAYENGHCAFFHPYDILTQKLHNEGSAYMNGWNKNSKIIDIMLCTDDDYLALHSERLLDKEKMIKAVAVSKYRTYDGRSMHAQGFKIIDKMMARVTACTVVPNNEFDKVESIYMKSGYTAGYPAARQNYRQAAEFVSSLM